MTMKEIAKKIIASINPGNADISGVGDGTIKGAIRSMVLSLVDPMLATEEGFPADALKTKEAISELNSKTTIVTYKQTDFFTANAEYFAMSARRIGNIVFARVLISAAYTETNVMINGGVLKLLKPLFPVNVRLAYAGATASYSGNLIINTNGNAAFSSTTAGKELAATFVYFTEDF